MKKDISLGDALKTVHDKISGEERSSSIRSPKPDLAAVANMHKIEERARESGQLHPAPPTRH